MPKPTKGKRLGGSPSHEDQIISNLIKALIEHEKIETTITKAKVAKPYVEKIITKAKSGTLHDRRQVLKIINDKSLVAKLFDEVAPKYEERQGGYTRIIRVGSRRGDGSEIAVFELV
jgi:large subunit ribosomal protein L17|tara:strand:+ start:1298 stop:1648 length:351 start_codon:yes stop_codon:yes gene_type:complete